MLRSRSTTSVTPRTLCEDRPWQGGDSHGSRPGLRNPGAIRSGDAHRRAQSQGGGGSRGRTNIAPRPHPADFCNTICQTRTSGTKLALRRTVRVCSPRCRRPPSNAFDSAVHSPAILATRASPTSSGVPSSRVRLCKRLAAFTVSPITVKDNRSLLPTSPPRLVRSSSQCRSPEPAGLAEPDLGSTLSLMARPCLARLPPPPTLPCSIGTCQRCPAQLLAELRRHGVNLPVVFLAGKFIAGADQEKCLLAPREAMNAYEYMAFD
jgi:hypothetical protein